MVGFDFSNIGNRQQAPTAIDPVDIFQSSTVTDHRVNDLWLGQGDALREWHGKRDLNDIAVVLNTGAGKTLVGLLIAQSLVNETRRQVLYSCSSIQLVEQTAEQARGYGIEVATYFRGDFKNGDAYFRANSPCVTTYQALFNGKTRFRNDDVGAVVFDDAHTADNILRDQFSLRITRNLFPNTYNELVALFGEYHRSVDRASSYGEVASGKSSRLFLIPPFELRRQKEELRRILSQAQLSEQTETMFAWEHIIDHEDLCCWLISAGEITMTPVTIPVSTLPYFQPNVKRIYLSATLSAQDAFARTFGRVPEQFVAPQTTAGECERMIVVPSMAAGVEDREDIRATIDIIGDKKAFILVPSYARGDSWNEIASPPTERVTEHLDDFRKAGPPTKLILTARYDGIDLPGDTCRVMVIDDLPSGAGPLERFQREWLNMDNSTRSTIASRVVQSFGRISRGMSDHGVVLLTGEALINWLRVPRNRSLLPEILQNQMKLGEEISESASSVEMLTSAVDFCLNRNPAWIAKYSEYMRASPPLTSPKGSNEARDIALAESSFGELLWKRDFHRAADVLSKVQDRAVQFSHHTGAWLTMWLAYAVEMAGNLEMANSLYRRACGLELNLPRLSPRQDLPATHIPQQIVSVAHQMQQGAAKGMTVSVPSKFRQDLVHLNGAGSENQTEEALRSLGQYLGLQSTRPDNEHGTGPDVLWMGNAKLALVMEVKTGKKETSSYTKDDMGQLRDHVQWVTDRFPDSEVAQVFVGPSLPASESSNPSPEMLSIELEQFESVGTRLISTLQDVADNTLPLRLVEELYERMKSRGLLWPEIFESLKKTPLI